MHFVGLSTRLGCLSKTYDMTLIYFPKCSTFSIFVKYVFRSCPITRWVNNGCAYSKFKCWNKFHNYHNNEKVILIRICCYTRSYLKSNDVGLMVIVFHKNVIWDALYYGNEWDIYAHDSCDTSIMLVYVILIMFCHLILFMVMLLMGIDFHKKCYLRCTILW